MSDVQKIKEELFERQRVRSCGHLYGTELYDDNRG